MTKASFDIAGKLDLEFRIARKGHKRFTFVDQNGDPFSLANLEIVLNVKVNPDVEENIFQLTSGAGLTFGANTIDIEVDEDQSDQPEVLRFWELYVVTWVKTWLAGNAYFISHDPSENNDSVTVTVKSNDAENITVVVSNGAPTNGNSETIYFNEDQFDGDGSEGNPKTIKENIFDTFGAASVVAVSGLLRDFDGSLNRFPEDADALGSGPQILDEETQEEVTAYGWIQRKNQFETTADGAWVCRVGQSAEPVRKGSILRALVDHPTQDPLDWQITFA